MKKMNVLSISMIACMASAAWADDVVHVYNWSDYIDEDMLKRFTEETGIRVVYDVFDTNELLETKMLTGGAGYDVVVPSDSFLQRQIGAGVFQPLDRNLLPNSGNEWDMIRARTREFDPDNIYSVNYMWGTNGIGMNVDMVRERLGDDVALDSMDVIFKPENMEKLADCGVNFLDSPAEVLPDVLTYMGKDPNTQDVDVINSTLEVLQGVRPYIRTFSSSDFIPRLASGEICVSLGYSGDILQARDRADEAGNGVNIAYFPFAEGSVLWFDQMAIPIDAPNPLAAHAFINFMLDPGVMAANSNYVFYANGNLPAQEFMDPEILSDPALYPDQATLDTMYVKGPWTPKAQRAATRLWTRLKSGS